MPHRDIIVIGGSAGGLQALQAIFPALPWDFPSSLFVVLHTSETARVSCLKSSIATASSQCYTRSTTRLFCPHGFISRQPAIGICCSIAERFAWNLGLARTVARPSIDALFRSASYAYGSQVIGVILSGNLDDGTAGLAAIKERGGLAVVQDPEEAVAPSMPASAIESTSVDFILPAEQIGQKLVELARVPIAEKIQPISIANGNVSPTGQTYDCPECGGVLNEMKEGGMTRFRCRVGHLYSPDSLLADQTEAVERALWAAIRSMEEQAEFSARLAENSRRKKHHGLSMRFTEKAESSKENAAILRDLLQKRTDEVLDVPLEGRSPEYQEKTGTE